MMTAMFTKRIRRTELIRLAAVVVLATVLPACSGRAQAASGPPSSGPSSSGSTSASASSWHLVALGDSLSRPNQCAGCTGYVDLYARAIARQSGVTVNVKDDQAIELSNEPAVDASALLAQILTDNAVRHDIANADIIVISVGFNDTPWNGLDDPCNAAPHYPVVQWAKLTPSCIDRVVAVYKHTLDQILTQIDRLRGCGEMLGVPPCSQRGASDTLLRIVTVYNSTIGDKVDPSWNSPLAIAPTIRANDLMVHAQCEVIGFHGGRCADIYHLMNGPKGNRPAAHYLDSQGYTELNQRGHNLAAAALIKLGLSPLR
jgi:lysophospholipase L1-like esterase